jgi:hypothetical protein
MFIRTAGALCFGIALTTFTANSSALTFATFDADQYDANGFAFGDFEDFNSPIDTSGGLISLDIMTDFDLVNGLFGGMGSDIAADFDSAPTQLEIILQVDPLNVASSFNIVLVDNDGPVAGVTGEEYQFNFDISSVTPGGGFVTLTQNLLNPGPTFRQPAFNQADGDMIQNFDLTQMQIQSVFGGTDRLKVDIQSVKLVDPGLPEDPLVVELTPATFAAQPQSFTFGTFSETGVVDDTNGNFVINADPNTPAGTTGGIGFNGLNFDFDATTHVIEVEAKLLSGNTADTFNVLLGDNDGDDSAPMMGSEDFQFTINTSEFNESDFTIFTLPIGSGTESFIETTFGFTNGGDGLQNFDLTQLQLQARGDDDLGILNMEFVRVSVVAMTDEPLPGDANGDGTVDLLDLDILGANFGLSPATFAEGDFNGDNVVDLLDLDILGGNFGATAPANAVPEPTSLLMASLLLLGAASRRRC